MEKLSKYANSANLSIILIVGLIFAGFSLVLNYQNNHLDPENVFWATIDNNLQTGGINRSLYNDGRSGEPTLENNNRFVFRGQLAMNSRVEIGHPVGIVSPELNLAAQRLFQDTRAFSDQDFIYYFDLETSDDDFQVKFDSFLANKWLIIENTNTPDPQPVAVALSDQLLSDYGFATILFGQLPRDDRLAFIEAFRSGVYTVDFASVRQTQVDGRTLYDYDVTVNFTRYLPILIDYLRIYGYSEIANELEASGAEPGYHPASVEISLQIDARARRLVKITNDQGRQEHISGYGINYLIDRPAADLSTRQLELILGDSL